MAIPQQKKMKNILYVYSKPTREGRGANSLAANATGKFDRSALFFLVISKGGVFECCETTN